MAPKYSEDEDDDEVDDEEEEEEEDDEEEEEPARKRKTKAFKDPNKPKRAMSAFFLYSQAYRQATKDNNPNASFGDIARLLARQFKELPEKEAKKWEKKAEQEKTRYKQEMKSYVPDPDAGGGKKSKKSKKDPNAPKRCMSAYFLYSIDARPKVKSEHPDASFGDVARMISSRFKNLSDKERKYWDNKAAQDKARYTREMEDYKS